MSEDTEPDKAAILRNIVEKADKRIIVNGEIPTLSEMEESVGILCSFDHTGEVVNPKSEDPEKALHILQQSIEIMHVFCASEQISPDLKTKAESSIGQMQSILDGFEVRKNRHLPGIYRQIQNVRARLPAMDKTTGLPSFDSAVVRELMNDMRSQPDVDAELIEQLQQEYKLRWDLLEEGVNPDVNQLFHQTYDITKGLDFQSISVCKDLLFQTRFLQQQLQKIQPLVDVQDDARLTNNWNDAIARISEAQAEVALRVADELRFRRSIFKSRTIPDYDSIYNGEAKEWRDGLLPSDVVLREIQMTYEVLGLNEDIPETAEAWANLQKQLESRRASALGKISGLQTLLDLYSKQKVVWFELRKEKRIDMIKAQYNEFCKIEHLLSETLRVFEFLVPGVHFYTTLVEINTEQISQ